MSAGRAINVVGGGAWGTALANAAAAAGHPVTLWLRDAEAAAALEARRENPRYLPGVPLHAGIRATAQPEDLAGARATLLVVPAQTVRGVLEALRTPLASAGPVILCAKGIERGSDSFMSAVAEQVLPPGTPVAVLSGPSFAADVARGLPTAVTLAASDPGLAASLSALLSGPSFRLYHTDDVRGVEIGGAGKNVLAIACGIVAGRGLGESARAALIARAYAELMRFARTFGGLDRLSPPLPGPARSRHRFAPWRARERARARVALPQPAAGRGRRRVRRTRRRSETRAARHGSRGGGRRGGRRRRPTGCPRPAG